MNLSEKIINLQDVEIIYDSEDCLVFYEEETMPGNCQGRIIQGCVVMIRGNTRTSWVFKNEVIAEKIIANGKYQLPTAKKVLYPSKFLRTHYLKTYYPKSNRSLEIKTEIEVEQWNPEINEFKDYIEL